MDEPPNWRNIKHQASHFVLGAILPVVLLVAGCAREKATMPPPGTVPGTATNSASVSSRREKVLVTPGNLVSGRVLAVRSSGRYVVLGFAPGHVPALDQRLSVYHLGLKVGEVHVSGPQLEENVIADLVEGTAEVGDEVRDR